jgi:transposase-like protein
MFMVCKICRKQFNNIGNLNSHIKKCEKIEYIKHEVYDLYVNKEFSIRDLKKLFKIQDSDVNKIVGSEIRNNSEANKIGYKRYPEKYKHSEQTKGKLREIRLKWMN